MVEQCEQFFWQVDDVLRTLFDKELTVAKSPIDADAGETGGACRGDIYFAVADIDAFPPKPLQSGIDHVGGWFATDVRLLFADGEVDDVGKETLVQLLDSSIRLVADDGCVIPPCLALTKQVENAWIGSGVIAAVQKVVAAKGVIHSF